MQTINAESRALHLLYVVIYDFAVSFPIKKEELTNK